MIFKEKIQVYRDLISAEFHKHSLDLIINLMINHLAIIKILPAEIRVDSKNMKQESMESHRDCMTLDNKKLEEIMISRINTINLIIRGINHQINTIKEANLGLISINRET